jgi:hypothetical protein
VPTSDPHTINACWFLFLLFAYLLVAEAASFDKKELCRSDTGVAACHQTFKKVLKNKIKIIRYFHSLQQPLRFSLKFKFLQIFNTILRIRAGSGARAIRGNLIMAPTAPASGSDNGSKKQRGYPPG